MADQKHLYMLRQGVDRWNAWRMRQPGERPDLRYASLSGLELSFANLFEADLSGAKLHSTNLLGAYLRHSVLQGAQLDAFLHATDLSDADLTSASFSAAHMLRTDLGGANLTGTDFAGARMSDVIFSNVDLARAKGLDAVIHEGPSTIGVDTLYRSGGNIPEAFLRGCGVPDAIVTFARSLVGKAIEYDSCFISYSSKDQVFADRLHADLQAKGVRCWFAPEDMKIGDKIWDRLDQSIRLHDKLLVILSGNSIGSDWVEDEVMTAFEEERKRHQTVLFPVRLDDEVMASSEAWAGLVRQRHIGDFRGWKEHDAYRAGFERLVRDLKAEATDETGRPRDKA